MTTSSGSSRTCECTAWELQYRDMSANTDKFYRLFVWGREWAVQWGRNGTAGQFGFKAAGSNSEALGQAQAQAAAKHRKGYEFTGGTAKFDVPVGLWESQGTTNANKGARLDHLFSQHSTATSSAAIQAKTDARGDKAREDFKAKLLKMNERLAKVTERKPDQSDPKPGESQMPETPVVEVPAAPVAAPAAATSDIEAWLAQALDDAKKGQS